MLLLFEKDIQKFGRSELSTSRADKLSELVVVVCYYFLDCAIYLHKERFTSDSEGFYARI